MIDRSLDYFLLSWMAALTWGLYSHYRRDQRQVARIIEKIEEMQRTVRELEV